MWQKSTTNKIKKKTVLIECVHMWIHGYTKNAWYPRIQFFVCANYKNNYLNNSYEITALCELLDVIL